MRKIVDRFDVKEGAEYNLQEYLLGLSNLYTSIIEKISFNPPSRKATAFGRRSRPTADEDGGREG